MATFKVTERQTIVVVYFVQADDVDMAREHVNALGCDEYDEMVENQGTEILDVEKLLDREADHARRVCRVADALSRK